MGRSSGIVLFKDIRGFRGGRGDHLDIWTGTRTTTGRKYFNFDSRSSLSNLAFEFCLVISLLGSWMSCNSSPSNTGILSLGDAEDSSDVVVEQYTGTRLQLSPKTCQVTAFDAQVPKLVQWAWQLEAAPGRCDFARDPKGLLRVVKTDKGDVIFVVSSKAESATSRWCDTKISALVYSSTDKGGLWSETTDVQNIMMCPPQQWDEKSAYVMAQHTRPLH